MDDLIATTLQRFTEAFPSEAACIAEFADNLPPDLKGCRKCGSSELSGTNEDRIRKCHSCKQNIYVTAGTAFERVKTGNVRIWRAAIFFWENGVALSAHRFSELFNCSYDAARNIYLRLGLLAKRTLSDGEFYAIPSSLFAEAICKRSIETPARLHPRSEELPFSEPEQERSDNAEEELQFPFDENEQLVFEQFQDSTPVQFETLSEKTGLQPGALSAALLMLELNELIKPLPGARYQRIYPEPKVQLAEQELEPILDAAIAFIREHFHGVSRKYLQIYVAIRWCMIDRTRWQPGALLKACTQARIPGRHEIKQFITDKLVSLPA